MRFAMDRQALVLLPALHGTNVLLQESRDFLPGVELLAAFSPGISPTVSHRLILLPYAIGNKPGCRTAPVLLRNRDR